jgi:hypothetical protein
MQEHDISPEEISGIPDSSSAARASRRGFLALSMLALAGCAAGGVEKVATLPMDWPVAPPPSPKKPTIAVPEPAQIPKAPPQPPPIGGVLPRTRWAKATPDYSQMEAMRPPRFITVHHDGMGQLFEGTSERACADRIEYLRNSHTRGRGFADLGYHYVVDRAGRVWEGRPLSYQGAHVKNRNEHNIGVLCLGNFDRQRPTDAQFAALCRHVGTIQKKYKIKGANVLTHCEWKGAATACPGVNLKSRFVRARNTGLS